MAVLNVNPFFTCLPVRKPFDCKWIFVHLLYHVFFFSESLWTDQHIQILLTEVHLSSSWNSIVPTNNNSSNLKLVWHANRFRIWLICYCNIKPRWTRQTQDACPRVTCLLNTILRASRLSNRPPFLKCFAFPSRKIPNEARLEGRFRPYVCLPWVFVSLLSA